MRCTIWVLAVALSALLGGERAMGQQSAAPPAAAPVVPAERGTVAIHIVGADYGHIGVHADCTVTETVRRICEGKLRCVVDVNDRLCPPPGELPRGLIFTLSVHYSCQAVGPAHFGAADKPFQLTIACQPNGS